MGRFFDSCEMSFFLFREARNFNLRKSISIQLPVDSGDVVLDETTFLPDASQIDSDTRRNNFRPISLHFKSRIFRFERRFFFARIA